MSRLLKAIDAALGYCREDRKPKLRLRREELGKFCVSDSEPQYSTAELREIARKFGCRPAPSVKDERAALVQGLWAAGVTRKLGICQAESDELDAKRGAPKITTLAKIALATQLGLVKRGLR